MLNILYFCFLLCLIRFRQTYSFKDKRLLNYFFMEVKGPNNTKHLVTFVGTLMVPDTSLPTQCDFIWLGTVRSEDNTVNILAFHTDDKNDFAKILTKYLKKLNDLQPSKNVQHQIDFIKQTLFELSSSLYVKTPPRDLLDMVAKKMKLKTLSPEQVIYTSGVQEVF